MITIYHQDTEGKQYKPLPENLDESDAQDVVLSVVSRLKKIISERIPVIDVPFSQRAENVLKRHHIHTLGELSEWPKRGFHGAGNKTHDEFRTELKRVGLPLPAALLI